MFGLSVTDSVLLKQWMPEPLLDALSHPEPSPAAIAEGCRCLDTALSSLVPFVPDPVLRYRIVYPEQPRIAGMKLTGSVLCADLSGFTALATRLAATGRQGSEELSAIINRLFAALLADIHAHGGGLLQFGGDALTAFFDISLLGNNHAALACAAALAIQERMAEFAAIETSCGVFTLRLRIAVYADTIFATEVGDQSHMHLVTTGRAINRVTVAQESAAPGEIVISAAMLRRAPGAQVEPKSGDLYCLHQLAAVPAASIIPAPACQSGLTDPATLATLIQRIKALLPYLPPRLPSRYLDATTMGGEFRPVTVLFTNFYAFDRLLALLDLVEAKDPDAAIVGRVLDTYYLHAQNVIRRYGGSINKIDMADFGNRLMALFGAPTAYEDDPERAVRAALDLRLAMHRASQEINQIIHDWARFRTSPATLLQVLNVTMPQRVGIASGVVFAGMVGTTERREYTVMGSTVNLSARLLATACEGDALLSSEVQRMTQHLTPMQPMAPLFLKGFAQPTSVFRIPWTRNNIGPNETVLRRTTPLMGRMTELARLRDLSHSALLAEEGLCGHVVALIGETGIGKSRLANEVLTALCAEQPSLLIARSACQGYEQSLPYAIFSRLLRQILCLAPGDPVAQTWAVQQQLDDLAPQWSRFAPLLAPLLNLPLAETELTRALPPEQRNERLQDLIITICQALARRHPLVIAIDDLHWADASSLRLIERLSREATGQALLLLLLYRRAPVIAEPWRDLAHHTSVELSELSSEANEALVSALLNGDPPAEVRPILERSYGTPFFLEETVYYFIEAGVLKRNWEGRWRCARPLDAIAIPSQIEQVIVARLDQLNDDARMLINVAAVIGQRIEERLLVAIPNSVSLSSARLHDLLEVGLLVPDESNQERVYRFQHALIRDVAYDSMLFNHRRELHATVAEVMEQVYGTELDGQRAVVAQHWLQAAQPDRAFPHFLQAAQEAQSRYANHEALALYDQVCATAPWRDQSAASFDLKLAASVYDQIGDIQVLIGDYAEARQSYEQGLAFLGGVEDCTAHCAALERKIGSSYENQGIHEQALDWFNRAAMTVSADKPTGDMVLEQARIFSDAGWVHFRRCDLDTAQRYLQQALVIFERSRCDEEQARSLNRLGGIAWQHGDLNQAQHYVERSLEASARSGDLVGQANALNNIGIITMYVGLLNTSLRYHTRAMKMNEHLGNKRGLIMSAINIGTVFYYLEDYAQAHNSFSESIMHASEARDSYFKIRALLCLGFTLIALQKWHDAEQTLMRSQKLAKHFQLPSEQLDSITALAQIALQQGALDKALERYQRALALVSNEEGEEYGRLQRLEAQLVLAQGDKESAIELLLANEALFARLQNAPEVEQTRRLLAELQSEREIGDGLRETGDTVLGVESRM
ncbi:MAG: tetratricopeptide repeat protein [Chloroflexales bacterium]|nr:tetratricopeptide repeat protein [Chloroflexales bacterium]